MFTRKYTYEQEQELKNKIIAKFGSDFVDAIYNSTTDETLCNNFVDALRDIAHDGVTVLSSAFILLRTNPGNQFNHKRFAKEISRILNSPYSHDEYNI